MSKKDKFFVGEGEGEKDISFTITEEEYKEAGLMAKEKGFSSVESLMKTKYQKFMRIYHKTERKER